jgi:hypothetical protein
MAPKKTKSKQTTKDNQTSSMDDKCVLLRDSSSKVNSIVSFSDVSIGKSSSLVVGAEVMYATADRERGRGTVLLIGMCALLVFLEIAIHFSL